MRRLTPWAVEAIDPLGQHFVVSLASPVNLLREPGHGVGGVVVFRRRGRFLPGLQIYVERVVEGERLRQRVLDLAKKIEDGSWREPP